MLERANEVVNAQAASDKVVGAACVCEGAVEPESEVRESACCMHAVALT